jgi:fatty acid desaturase
MERSADPGHRAALAALGEGRIAALSQTSDRPGLIRLAGHLSLLALTGAAVLATEGPARLALQFLHGTVLIFLFSAAHEAIHRTAFRSHWLNDRVAWAAGLPILLPPNGFRFFHFAHHRWTQDPARDPELSAPKPRSLPEYLWRLTGWHYWSGQVQSLVNAALGRPLPDYVPPRGAAKVRREARVYLAIYTAIALASLATGATLALTLWVVPALLGQPVLRAYLMAEHTACPLVPDMLTNSRTTFTHRLLRWLAWEMPFHGAHHAAPTVPFHHLADLTAEIRDALGTTAQGYTGAHRQILDAIRTGA